MLYIQRATFSDHKGPITGIDQLLVYDYMGNSYFEFGALNRSLKRLASSDLVINKTVYKSSINRGLFVINRSGHDDEVNAILQDMITEHLVEELTYLSNSLEYDIRGDRHKHRYSEFECWWDIRNDVIFCLGKNNAKRLVKGITAIGKIIGGSENETNRS